MSHHIFRDKALRRYNDSFAKTVLPRYISPPWPTVLWLIAGFLLACTALLWSIQIPVYASGPGVIVQAPDDFVGIDPVVLAAFIPAEFAARLQIGQPVTVHLAEATLEMSQTVAAIEPSVAAPATVRARYNLDGSTGLLVEGPTIVALIRLAASAETMVGSVGEVQIEVGTRRGVTLLPGLGRFFSDG